MNLTNHKNSAGITNIGKHRKKNEDCFTIDRIQHKPSVRIITQELGDLFLLCSDGLTNMLNKEEIAEIIGKGKNKNNKNLYNICYQLVDAANNAGGQDNITVVLIR